MIAGEARTLSLGGLCLLAMALYVAISMEVTTDITHFLPGGRSDPEVRLAKELAAGELSRTMVLLVDGESTEAAIEAGRAFETELLADPRVSEATANLDAGPPVGVEEAFWKLYHPRRFSFFAPDLETVEARLQPEALRSAAAYLKRRLSLPISGLISRVAPEDPTLILPGLFERLQGGSGEGLATLDGRFVTEDGGAAILFLTTHASSTDSTAQAPLLAGVRAAFERVAAGRDDAIALSMSGANRFAIRAERAIQADIQRVSIGSTVGLALLLFFLFRSFRLVLLVLPVVGAGFLAGTSACLLLFGSVHGLTLAFGAAMIGVSIDYAVHFHCHQSLAPHPAGPRATLHSIWRGLSLGAATTIAGFVALLLSSFPGLRELAVFASTGILGALIATRVFLPALAVRGATPVAAQRLARALSAVLAVRGAARYLLALPSLGVLVLLVFGLPRVRWNDGLADLNRLDPDLLAEDEGVRERVVRYEQGRIVVATGVDEEAALAVNDRVARALEAAQAAGELEGLRSLSTLLPSRALQRSVDARVRAEEELWPRMRSALLEEGFVVDGFLPFRDALLEPAPEPLCFDDLAGSALGAMVRSFRVGLGADPPVDAGDAGDASEASSAPRVGILSLLHGVHDEAALRRRLEGQAGVAGSEGIEGAQLVNLEAAFSRAYRTYRAKMMWLALLGLVAVLALVALRHRAVRPTLIAYVPAVLSAGGTVAALSLLGIELNVLSLVALLMVVSMGVDYGVFLAETSGEETSPEALQATHLAVFVAGTSTLLGFGLLAFSDQPPLFSIGITAGIGVLFCFLLAPTLNALLSARSGSSRA